MQVYISRELALRLGCIEPTDMQHHREMKKGAAFLLVRDPQTMAPLFWPVVPAAREES